jgi:hypothetical protein
MFKAATMIAVRYKRHDGLIEFFDTDGLERSVGPNYRRILSARRVDCVPRAAIRDEDTVTMRPVDVSDLAVWTGHWLVGKTIKDWVITSHTPAQRKVTAYKVVKAWPDNITITIEQAVRDGHLEAVYD